MFLKLKTNTNFNFPVFQGPILAGTFGHVIKKYELRNLGIKSEIKGLFLCVLFGKSIFHQCVYFSVFVYPPVCPLSVSVSPLLILILIISHIYNHV